jgi:hypothetical protein
MGDRDEDAALPKEEGSAQSDPGMKEDGDRKERDGQDQAAHAVVIQRLYRTRLARRNLVLLMKSVYEKVYDESTGAYFYFNSKTGESQWTKPVNLGNEEVDLVDDGYTEEPAYEEFALDEGTSGTPEESDARVEIESLAVVPAEAKEVEQGSSSAIELKDDAISLNGTMETLSLSVPQAVANGGEQQTPESALVVSADRDRKPNYKDWDLDDVCDFFKELELDEYIPALQKFKVNGPLLYTLTLQDFKELGIFSNLRIRRIRYELQKYYIKKAFKVDDSDSDNDEDNAKEQDELALLENESNVDTDEDAPEFEEGEDGKEGTDDDREEFDYDDDSDDADDEGEDAEASDSDVTTDSSVDEDERRRKFLTEDDLNDMAEDEHNIKMTRSVAG